MSEPLEAWLDARRANCRMSVRGIPWCECRSWRFAGGRLEHLSGGFFSVVGVRSASSIAALHQREQPIIDQPEVGILGFLVREGWRGREWLVQAKAEPGNLRQVQLAPSVQATRSNFTRLHGGAATAYLELFRDPDDRSGIVADSLQSEHGNRFLGKYNRNMTVAVDANAVQPESADWRWTPASELRALLVEDLAVNTDARSVLFCTDWQCLADESPFAGAPGRGDWKPALHDSYVAGVGDDGTGTLEWLERQRAAVELGVEPVALEEMAGWVVTARGIARRDDGRMLVGAYGIEASSREVQRWDQPLLIGQGEEAVLQLCQCRDGVLRFLFRASAEIGFREKLQLGPTWQSDDPGDAWGCGARLLAASRGGRERHAVLQSDEGGRFHSAVCRYRIVELPEGLELDLPGDCFRALDLGEVSRLAKRQGVFSNEARSAMSMLLSEL